MQGNPSAGNNPAPSAAAFAAGLLAEREALGNFIDLLRAEQEVLVRGDADRLAELAPGKAAQIELLSVLGEQRKRNLSAQNLTDDKNGMLAWLSRNRDSATTVRKTWRELLAGAETARQLNQTNGLLIENRLQQNRMKLTVLQTQAAPDGVYRQDGHLRPLRSGRSLNQA